MNQTILVTGGAGYIGTHAVKELRKEGFEVIVLDNLVYGHRELVEQVLDVSLVVGDICDRSVAGCSPRNRCKSRIESTAPTKTNWSCSRSAS